MKATRDHFGQALLDVGADHDSVVLVNCDLASATKTGGFKQRFPERFFECGIAEANGIGIAAGLAQEGYRPFVASFGHFLTGKYLEIFQSIGLNDSGVVMVGTHAGLGIGKDGPTQMGLRDVSLMRTLPNVEILHPADGIETQQMLAYLAGGTRPAYLRLCRQPQREIHSEDYQFRFGVPDVVHEGSDLVVFTMGGMVEVTLDALEGLAARGLDPTVVNVSSLPVDADALKKIVAGHTQVYVVEDHYVVGGLADEIGGLLLRLGLPVRFGSWGVSDYGQAGSPAELYRRYQLDAEGVVSLLDQFATPVSDRSASSMTVTDTPVDAPIDCGPATKDLVGADLDRNPYVFSEHVLEPGRWTTLSRQQAAVRTFVVIKGSVRLEYQDVDRTVSRTYGQPDGWHAPAGAVFRMCSENAEAVVLEAGAVIAEAVPETAPPCTDLSTYTVSKPWGHEVWYTENLPDPPYALKQIHMTAGHQSSLQSHEMKIETNYVIDGEATVLNGPPAPADRTTSIDVSSLPRARYRARSGWTSARNILHRVIAATDYTSIEISTPELDDVVRWADDAGRSDGRIDSEHASAGGTGSGV